MADIEKLKRGLVNAHKKGDLVAAKTFAMAIKQEMAKDTPPVAPEPNATDGMSTTEKVLAGVGMSMIDAKNGLGQMVGLVDQKDIDAAKENNKDLANSGAGTAGNIIGNIAMLAPTSFIPGANSVRGASLINALAGAAITPGSAGDRGLAAFYGGAGGGGGIAAGKLLSGTSKAAAAAAAPLTEGGQNKIIADVMRRAAGENVDSVIARMNAAKELIPGSVPTAAEVAESGGIASLQRAMSAANPEAYTQRGMQQASARVGAVRGIAQDEKALQAAIAARQAAANPLYAAADSAVVSSNDALRNIMQRLPNGTLEQAKNIARMEGRPIQIGRDVPAQTIYKDAAGELVDSSMMKPPTAPKARSLLDEIKKAGGIKMDEIGELGMTPGEAVRQNPALFQRKGMSADGLVEFMAQQGWIDDAMIQRANQYDTGGALELAKDYLRSALSREPVYHPSEAMDMYSHGQQMQDFGEFAAGVTKTDIPAKNAQYTGRGLDLIKKGIDEAVSSSPGMPVIGKHQQRAAMGVKEDLLKWADAAIPEYGQARKTFQDMSKPINQMQVGQELLGKMQGPLADHGALASETGAMYARALNDASGNLVKNSTGGIRQTLESVMSPDQMMTLNNVAQDLARKSNAQNLGRGPGSNTFQNFAMDNIAAQSGMPSAVSMLANLVPGMGTVGGLAKATGNLIYKSKDEVMKGRMAELLLDPVKAASVMESAVQPGRIGQVIQGSIGQGGVDKITRAAGVAPSLFGAALALPYGSQ